MSKPYNPQKLPKTRNLKGVIKLAWRDDALSRLPAGLRVGVDAAGWLERTNELLGFNAGTAPYTLKQYGYSWGAQPL